MYRAFGRTVLVERYLPAQVPGIVASKWREACQASQSGANAPQSLGTIRTVPNGAGVSPPSSLAESCREGG